MKKSAIIIGSSGLIGRSLVGALNSNQGQSFSKVTAVVRKPDPSLIKGPNLEQQVIDFERLEAHSSLLKVDVIFCCLGTTIKVAGSEEMFRHVDFDYVTSIAKLYSEVNPNGHFILISSLGADATSRVFYSRVKGEVENYLLGLKLKRVSVLRPSLLLGKRDTLRFGEKIGEVVSLLLKPLLIGPLRKYRAIKATTVAAAMLTISQSDSVDHFKIIESDQIDQLTHRN